ncbi:MAG: M23 family metallopeptidase [Nitrospirota bacterium]
MMTKPGLAAAAAAWCLWAAAAYALEPAEPPLTAPKTLAGRQGDVVPLIVTVPARGATPVGQSTTLVGRMGERAIPFFPLDPPGRFGALVGLDLDEPVGTQTMTLWVDGEPAAELSVTVERQHFPVQTLTLPDEMVQLDEATLVRVNQEQKDALAVMAAHTPERWWAGEFVLPADGELRDSFGRRRIINGEPRSPHTGEDISAPEGAEVVASNSGVVRLVADHFFSGKSVFLDHGGGLYTMYFHLASVAVAPSQRVEKGQIIGAVGATGRATGPHLHWGARLNGARINPLQLLRPAFP